MDAMTFGYVFFGAHALAVAVGAGFAYVARIRDARENAEKMAEEYGAASERQVYYLDVGEVVDSQRFIDAQRDTFDRFRSRVDPFENPPQRLEDLPAALIGTRNTGTRDGY